MTNLLDSFYTLNTKLTHYNDDGTSAWCFKSAWCEYRKYHHNKFLNELLKTDRVAYDFYRSIYVARKRQMLPQTIIDQILVEFGQTHQKGA